MAVRSWEPGLRRTSPKNRPLPRCVVVEPRGDALDARFADLVLWSDHDGSKTSTLAEMEPLAVRGVLSIELSYDIDRRCDDRGNCEVERASFTFIDRGGEVRNGDIIDVHLACQ